LADPAAQSDVRPVDNSGLTNPILHIEELHRVPPLGSRVPPPGARLVFRDRGGRLRSPNGGYTAGEMFVRGPRVLYVIDVTEYAFEATFTLDRPGDGNPLLVAVSGFWAVNDPRAVVQHRVSDTAHVCVSALSARIDALVEPAALTAAAAEELLKEGLDRRIPLAEGILLTRVRAKVSEIEAMTSEKIVRYVIAEDEDDDPADPAGAGSAELIQEARNLAVTGLAAFTAQHGEAALDTPIGAALTRFQEMVTRLGAVLPEEPEQDDDAPG